MIILLSPPLLLLTCICLGQLVDNLNDGKSYVIFNSKTSIYKISTSLIVDVKYSSMRILFMVMMSVLSSQYLAAQNNDLKNQLYKLERKVIAGDIEALKEVSIYVDDSTYILEFLGRHRYPNTARGIAIRIIKENCLFTEEEFRFDSLMSTTKILKILNSDKVSFDDKTGMFVISGIEKRVTSYELKELSEFDLKRIDAQLITQPHPDWYYEYQIEGFLFTKNPEVLMWIASAWYKKRSRFNSSYFNDEEFLNLMKKLTNVEVGVPDGNGKTTFLYGYDYYATTRLNYLIYWATHYKDYKWNDQKKYFENVKESPSKKTKEDILFPLLKSENDSLAMDAFIQLTELDPVKIKVLADDYDRGGYNPTNYTIPTFPFRFLPQISLLTEYCRHNGVEYKTQGWLLDSLNKLTDWPGFTLSYRLEDDIIDRLTLNDVTMVEYFGLIYEKQGNVTFSIGRILDKFYSKKWKDLISDEKSLLLFLKKAKLFEDLGIIGIAGKYLLKFKNCSPEVISQLKQIYSTTSDFAIKESSQKVIDRYGSVISIEKSMKKPRIKISKYGVSDLKGEYKAILKKHKEKDKVRWALKELFAKINYDQLGEAVSILKSDTNYEEFDDPYWIIGNDFGIDLDSSGEKEIAEFVNLHKTKTEYEVYKFYFEKKGVRCLDESGNFIFDKTYDLLKYGVVDAFVGGGGGRRETGVYEIIRLLEIKFETRLGFPEKFCESEGVYSCVCTERANAWIQFLEEKKLVVVDKNEPPSISNNE